MLKNLSPGKFFRSVKKIIALVIFTAIFFGLFYALDRFFLVRTVIIEGDAVKTLNGVSTVYNKNISLVRETSLTNLLIEQNPRVRSVTVSKMYPDKLSLYIKLYEPYVVMPTNRGYLVLAENARILEKTTTDTFNVPVINYYQKINHDSVNPGDKIEYKDVLVSLHFLGTVQDLGMRPNTIDINGLDMILFNLDDKTIRFTTEKSTDIQDYELGQVIKQFRIEGRTFKSLDLRYDKPIVQFQ